MVYLKIKVLIFYFFSVEIIFVELGFKLRLLEFVLIL